MKIFYFIVSFFFRLLPNRVKRRTSWGWAGPSSVQTGTWKLVSLNLTFVAKNDYMLYYFYPGWVGVETIRIKADWTCLLELSLAKLTWSSCCWKSKNRLSISIIQIFKCWNIPLYNWFNTQTLKNQTLTTQWSEFIS